jgi:hypothetical protein
MTAKRDTNSGLVVSEIERVVYRIMLSGGLPRGMSDHGVLSDRFVLNEGAVDESLGEN